MKTPAVQESTTSLTLSVAQLTPLSCGTDTLSVATPYLDQVEEGDPNLPNPKPKPNP